MSENQQTDEESSAPARAPLQAPLCFVVDEEPSIRHFLSLILHGAGIDTQEFPDGRSLRQALAGPHPDLICFNVSLEANDAIESIAALGKHGYKGPVQLMSSRGSAVLENIKSIGEQYSLKMLPVLKKPFETSAVQKIINDLKLGLPSAVAARIDLREALDQGWIEFWYQPKINLRKKQLNGAEAFARARHPEFGVLSPSAFMPGADPDAVLELAKLGIIAVLKTSTNFMNLGLNLKFAVNVPVDALIKLPIADIIDEHRPPPNWPGMIIDITEEQIVSDLALAYEITKKLERYNIKLAIDDFGRGYSSLMKLKSLPFAEMKLDRTFVSDCGTDKVNAPICKTVIDLAHNFGASAVAIGIEKATDMLALVSMGCDFGQGYLFGQPMPEQRFLSLLKQRAGVRPLAAQPAA
jgi:EAL domain-containing protein (putative c-di-GMP-specific phosphodiesterase class I)